MARARRNRTNYKTVWLSHDVTRRNYKSYMGKQKSKPASNPSPSTPFRPKRRLGFFAGKDGKA